MTQKRVEAFLKIADEEFDAAERLSGPLPRQAFYFLQQSVEKLVRAVLEFEDLAAGTTHSLAYLAGLLPAEHGLRESFKDFEHLSSASTRYRYPSSTGVVHEVSRALVRDNLGEVGKLRAEVRAFVRHGIEGGVP